MCDECEDTGLLKLICGTCNGSGEGQYDGSKCNTCRGCGLETVKCDCEIEPVEIEYRCEFDYDERRSDYIHEGYRDSQY